MSKIVDQMMLCHIEVSRILRYRSHFSHCCVALSKTRDFLLYEIFSHNAPDETGQFSGHTGDGDLFWLTAIHHFDELSL